MERNFHLPNLFSHHALYANGPIISMDIPIRKCSYLKNWILVLKKEEYPLYNLNITYFNLYVINNN
jgi:hypothetical protein